MDLPWHGSGRPTGTSGSTSSGIVKSVSTIQLLGQLQELDNTIRSKERRDLVNHQQENEFQRGTSFETIFVAQENNEEISECDIDVLLATSKAVLSTVQILRRIIRQYTYGRIGRELQHLSLSVAAFERVLFSFIKEEIVEPYITYENFSPVNKSSSGLGSRPTINLSTTDALKDIVPMIDRAQRHAILTGGIASLLRHASRALLDTRTVLEQLHRNYDPYRKSRCSLGLLLGIVFFLIGARRYLKSSSWWGFFKRDLFKAQSIKAIIVAIVFMDYSKRFMYRYSKVRSLKICHARVLITLRMFLLCQHILQRARLNRSNSLPLLITEPREVDIDDNQKNATVLLVERVPLPADYYTFASNDVGLTLFKKGSDVFFASSYKAYRLLGGNTQLWKTFGPALQALLIPYYAVNHVVASSCATRVLMDQPNIDVIRQAWSVFGESAISRFVSKLISPRLPLRQKAFVNNQGSAAGATRREPSDIGVYLFSARSMKDIREGTWKNSHLQMTEKMLLGNLPTSRPVLFYVHGGGFFGRFLSHDMTNLSHWAAELGALIVYPDYGLAPETQYPVSLEECFTVYKWITSGGLGFVPDRVVLFGESAGGNIAAALAFKILGSKLQKPDGLVLCHPALNLYVSPSPSRFLHQNDPILPRGVLELALNSYYPQHEDGFQYVDNVHDPFVSPGHAPDRMLRALPCTHLVVGGLDPLLDDSVDFNTRLRRLGVSGQLRVFSGLTHGFFLCRSLVPEALKAINCVRDLIGDILLKPTTLQAMIAPQ